MIKFLKLPKIIGSVLNIKASDNIDVSADLAKDATTQKSISELLNNEEKKDKQEN